MRCFVVDSCIGGNQARAMARLIIRYRKAGKVSSESVLSLRVAEFDPDIDFRGIVGKFQ